MKLHRARFPRGIWAAMAIQSDECGTHFYALLMRPTVLKYTGPFGVEYNNIRLWKSS